MKIQAKDLKIGQDVKYFDIYELPSRHKIEMINMITDNYDYINKMGAVKFWKDYFPSVAISVMARVYESIEQYNI